MLAFRRDLTRRMLTTAVWAASVTILAACAGGPAASPSGSAAASKADSSPEALVKRAQAYWDLVRKNDNVEAWAYEAQSRNPRASLEAYLKKGGITYSNVKVVGVKSLEGNSAMVDIEMTYSAPLQRMKDMQLRTEDPWELIEGVWYHSYRRSGLFPTK